MLALRHLRKKRREAKNNPSTKRHAFLDHLVYAAAIVGPVMTLPQIQTIWISKTADGVSAASWGTYAILSTIWIAYGAVHKEKLILFSSVVGLLINSAVAIGAMIY